MEFNFELLVIVISLIVFIVNAINKNKSGKQKAFQNNVDELSFETVNNEQTGDNEQSNNQNWNDKINNSDNKFENNEFLFENYNSDYEEKGRNDQINEKENKTEQRRKMTSTQKSSSKKTTKWEKRHAKHIHHKSNSLEEIIRKFDGKKAIIYSEIISRKHF